MAVTRAEIIELLADKFPQYSSSLLQKAAKQVFNQMSKALEQGHRIEIRDLGSFDIRYHLARPARNPKTGEKVMAKDKKTVHFKAGKELKTRVKDLKDISRFELDD